MNPFDTLTRPLPRPADAPSPRDSAPGSAPAGSNHASPDADSFSALLQGFSERPPQKETEPGSADQARSAESVAPANGSATRGADVLNSVLTLLQGILPGVAPQPNAAEPDAREQGGDASSLPSLAKLPLSPDQDDGPALTAAPKLMVSVEHQETHFKPVLEKVEAGLRPDDATEIEFPLGDDPLRKPLAAGSPERPTARKDMRVPGQPVPAMLAVAEHEAPDDMPAVPTEPEQQATRGSGEALESRRDISANAAKPGEATGLPAESLHRLATAVRSDLQTGSGNAAAQSQQGQAAAATLSIRASESALRVLHLQLHPADLGAVTLKMRLAGDSLQMELHVEREETAQLLRHDSEKLSALLRGSGYRPDVISVQVVDPAVPDRGAPRAQVDPQMQGQPFPNGGSGQGGQFREQDKPYARTRAERHQDVEQDQIPGGHHPGGVYL